MIEKLLQENTEQLKELNKNLSLLLNQTNTSITVGEPATVEPVVVEEPEPKKKKASKAKPKKETKPEPEEVEEEAQEEETEEEEAPEESPSVSIEEVTKVAQTVAKEQGRAVLEAALAKVGAKRISTADPSQLAELHQILTA